MVSIGTVNSQVTSENPKSDDRIQRAFIAEETVQAKSTYNLGRHPSCKHNRSNHSPKRFVSLLHQRAIRNPSTCADHSRADEENQRVPYTDPNRGVLEHPGIVVKADKLKLPRRFTG